MRSFKWLKPILFLLITFGITLCLNYALIPPNAVRINLHNLRNGESYDTVYIGTSHGQYGINPAAIDRVTGGNSVSLCMADVYPDDMYYLLKLASETQTPSYVVYELDPSYWMNEQRSGSTQIFFYREFPFSKTKVEYFTDKIDDLDFRSTLAPWTYYKNLYMQIPSTIKSKQSSAYKSYDPSILDIPIGHYGGKGFIYRNRVEGENKGAFNNIPWEETKVKSNALQYFDRLVSFCDEKEIPLIVITTPVPQDTWDNFRESYEKADSYFTELVSEYGLNYYNFNHLKPELLDRSMNGYWDYDGHMDGVLADEYSNVLGELLSKLQDGTLELSDYFLE